MIRGEVYDARFDPVEGSEQGGIRPAVIVSRDQLNAVLHTVVVVPCSSYRPGRRVYAAQVLLRAPEGGLRVDSVVLGEQVRVLAKHRLLRRRGVLSPRSLAAIEQILAIALDLPGQG
jgi:mRNA interferase MazF